MVTAQTKAHDKQATLRQTKRVISCARTPLYETVARGSIPAPVFHAPCSDSERKCLATGAIKPKFELIRFVLDPAHNVIPDLAAKLPGRGLWVSADREALQSAIKKNLFSRAVKANAKVSTDLLDQVENLLAKRCLDLLGLAKSAGALVIGQPQVEEAIITGKLAYVLLAGDAGKDIQKKLSHLCHHRENGNDTYIIFSAFTRTQLGEALGREHLVAIGLMPHKLTEHLYLDLTRWRGVMSDIKTRPDSEQT